MWQIEIQTGEMFDLFATGQPGTFDGKVVRDADGREYGPGDGHVAGWNIEYAPKYLALRRGEGWENHGHPPYHGCKVTARCAEMLRAAVAAGYLDATAAAVEIGQ